MSLSLVGNSFALAPNIRSSFLGAGGTPPYTYSVVSGGGSIDVDGYYTAPKMPTAVVLKVVDSLAAEATADVMVGSAAELLCDIIQTSMELESGQVYLWDQKYNIPNDDRIYVVVGVTMCKPFSNINRFQGTSESEQITNFMASMSIDVISRSTEALNRKEEVVLALMSDYSQSQQELNSLHIAKIPTGFVNLSEVDGAAIPYRFNIAVNVQYAVTKKQAVPYFDQFEDAKIEQIEE